MMNLVNNLINSEAVNTALCTIVEGSIIHSSAAAVGNLIEDGTDYEMLQTVGKILQSAPTAFLALWAAGNLAEAFGKISGEYMDIVNFSVMGLALCVPLIFQEAKHFYPENKEKIENLQKSYFRAISIVNLATAAIAIGGGSLHENQPIAPIVSGWASLFTSNLTMSI